MKLIGVGLGRTGTTSIEQALDLLGYRTYNIMGVGRENHFDDWHKIFKGEVTQPDWDSLLAGYQATIAWPVCFFYKEMMETYPDAKFVLTVRDAESWADSFIRSYTVIQSFRALSFIPRARGLLRLLNEGVIASLFEGEVNHENAVAAFERYNAAVQRDIPAEKLLVYEMGQGWESLCELLDIPVPDVPFPHANKGENFADLVQKFIRNEA